MFYVLTKSFLLIYYMIIFEEVEFFAFFHGSPEVGGAKKHISPSKLLVNLFLVFEEIMKNTVVKKSL